jgi:hypothetical protein
MATQYTLNFSDPSKTNTITINGPTKNNYSTSLDLVGPGYVAYGEALAQDFLKLLENFASPNAPLNPIEGQLWYDTSNPNRKVLRINNGAPTSARWPSANGIYQQANDPSIEYSQNLIDGDMWVDTGNSQLKIRYGNAWTLVGPNVSTGETKTGSESVNLVSNTGGTYPVILNWVNGKVIEIIAYHEFTPRTVIDGFSNLNPGINLTTRVAAKYNGLADRAKALEISNGIYIQASEVLKNVWPTSQRQTHAGSLIVESPQGLFVKRQNGREIQIYTTTTGAVINFDNNSSILKVGIHNRSYIKFDSFLGTVAINTNTVSGVALTVNGSGTFKENLTISAASSATSVLDLGGSASILGNATVVGNLTVFGRTELSTASSVTVGDVIPVNSTTDLGSASKPFESVYVKNIGSSTTYVKIYGSVTTATTLETVRNFQISGQMITQAPVQFNGAANVTLVTTASSTLISAQTVTTSTTATQTLMVLNTASGAATGLEQISKRDFLADVYTNLISTGMIIGYVNPGPYPGWLYCNGSEHTATTYVSLFALIGTTYGTASFGKFRIPNLTTATISGTNGAPVYYHIKT